MICFPNIPELQPAIQYIKPNILVFPFHTQTKTIFPNWTDKTKKFQEERKVEIPTKKKRTPQDEEKVYFPKLEIKKNRQAKNILNV